jgi:hypothetical protein
LSGMTLSGILGPGWTLSFGSRSVTFLRTAFIGTPGYSEYRTRIHVL